MAMGHGADRVDRRTAMRIGFVGGALVGVPSYFFAGDPANVLSNIDAFLVLGILIRIAFFGVVGLCYAYLVPLPLDRWTAFERGILAPGVFAALIFNATPNTTKLDQQLSSFSFVNVAHAQSQDEKTPSPSPIRQIIRGILGK